MNAATKSLPATKSLLDATREQMDAVERSERETRKAERNRERRNASERRRRAELKKEVERAIRHAGKYSKRLDNDARCFFFGWLTGAADVSEEEIERWLSEGNK